MLVEQEYSRLVELAKQILADPNHIEDTVAARFNLLLDSLEIDPLNTEEEILAAYRAINKRLRSEPMVSVQENVDSRTANGLPPAVIEYMERRTPAREVERLRPIQ